ncbi:MAG: hypothetical protein II250_04680 [Agathobacter sp.]|nr:hypothetical protein [Agathobacter sp.]
MKKKVIILVSAVILVLAGGFVIKEFSPNSYDVDKIVMYDSLSSVEVSRESEIETIMDLLTGHIRNAEEVEVEEKDGGMFSFEIEYKNGSKDRVVIYSDDMVYNEKGYESSAEMCTELREIFDRLK